MSIATFTRLHARLENEGKAVQEWHYDDPKRVTLGYLLGNDLWVPVAGIDAQIDLIERRSSKETWLIIPDTLNGLVGTSDGKFTLDEWRKTKGARKKKHGYALRLEAQTKVVFNFGSERLLIWITEPPLSQKSHPFSTQLTQLFREIPRFYFFALFVSALIHVGIFAFIRNMPGLETIMPSTVEDRFARITIRDVGHVDPELQRRLEEANSMGIKIGGGKIQRQPNPIDATGFIQAVVSPAKTDQPSSFSNLFTASSFTKDLNQALSGKSFGDVLNSQMKALATRPSRGGDPGGTETGALLAAPTMPSGSLPSAGPLGFQAGASAPPTYQAPTREARSSGTLDKSAINRVFNQHSAELEDCFQNLLLRNPGASGKITAVFEVLPSGKASNVRVEESTLQDANFRQCVIQRIQIWSFPPPQGGSATFRFPLIFSASSKN